MNNINKSVMVVVIGVLLLTAASSHYLTKWMLADSPTSSGHTEQQPSYWVAPMDPNYRRDKPGKSPMGMDLIPVFATDSATKKSTAGTITISPDVVNNIGVRTVQVKRRKFNTEITTVGYVQFDQDKLVHIHPRVEGWIEKLFVTAAGNSVKKGEPLYSLYSPQLVNAQEELVLALSRNNTRLVNAAEQRLQALQIDHSVITKLKRERKIQQTVTFYAPQTGVVDKLNIREGFFVKPGTTLMSIGNLTEVWVEAAIFERQAALVKAQQAVTMTLDYLPSKQWQGKVDYVYPTLDPTTRTVKVRLRFRNDNGLLKPNMFAQLSIHSDAENNVLMIPREALIRTGKQDRVVLALGEGRFKSVAVLVGRMGEQFVEIVEGINAGETVVTSAQFLLDSESSKTSDFKRMHHGDDNSTTADNNSNADHSSVNHSTINSVETDHSSHQMSPAAKE